MTKYLTCCLLAALICVLAMPALTQDAQSPVITILAKQNLALHNKPDFYSNVLGIFESDETLNAFGRDTDGVWLQTAEGWVNARNVAADGDIVTLRQTAEAITLQASDNLDLRSGPDGSYRTSDSLPRGHLTVAIGRNHDGTWLETLNGWIPASEVDFDGDIMALPVSFASITVSAEKNAAFLSAPTWEADVLEIFERGSDAFAYERTEDADWVKTPKGWVHISRGAVISGDLTSLPLANIVALRVRTETGIFSRPDVAAEQIGSIQKGDEVIALNRSADGAWLQIPIGWVLTESIVANGDILRLPDVTVSIPFTAKRNRVIWSVPSISKSTSRYLGTIAQGENALAIGRDEKGIWLQIDRGWISISASPQNYIQTYGDIMSLAVTEGATGSSTVSHSVASASHATPTPKPLSSLDAATLRTLIARHTDDIRILDIETSSSATKIEYDLKPWPFVPNESIADEVAFKIICAIRNGQQIPNTLQFIGHTHFKSGVGRKFTGPSVEMHISASNANRIVCRGNDPSDINWRSLASRYKSYPIPRGASIDYD
ncbi:MAG: SH3 domain-containing protein [Chloroflexi bacterium]|nr:SH3 domain-containing protein [Chloroflexota bacterium]